jgi:hypothetical protein
VTHRFLLPDDHTPMAAQFRLTTDDFAFTPGDR